MCVHICTYIDTYTHIQYIYIGFIFICIYVCVSHRHRGGRIQKINAWYLNTHMVYLQPKQSLGY